MILDKTLGEVFEGILHVQLGTIFFGTLNILVTLTMIYIVYLILLRMYQVFTGFKKELKELRDLRDTIKAEKPFTGMSEEIDKIRKQEYLKAKEELELESMNSIELEEENQLPNHCVDITEEEPKEIIEPTKVKSKLKPTIQDKIDKIHADRKLKISNEAGKIVEKKSKHKGMKPSNDRELYPNVFKELYTLTDILIGMVGVSKLAKKLGGTPGMVVSFQMKQIATKKTAQKHIDNMKKVLEELQDSEKKMTIEESIEETYGLASQDKINELYKLYETIHDSGMSQAQIALRLEVSQPVISAIARKQIAKASQVTEYTHRLKVVAGIIGK